ncbi:hypothetical protein LCGC14_1841230, partial [marine sediment metagenome]
LVGNYEVLSITALSTAAVYWVTELVSRDRRAGVFVFLLVFLLQYTSSIFLAHTIADPAAPSGADGWGRLHVVPATFAYTALAFAAVYGLLHLLGQRNLKQHRFGLLFDRLPALDLLGKMSWHALVVGFVFLSISVVTGIFTFRHVKQLQPALGMDPKVVYKIVIGSMAWGICALAIFGKVVLKWSASRVSVIAVVGFLAAVILIVSSIVLS